MPVDPRDDLKRLAPYLADIRQAAGEKGVRTEVLAGVCLRESIAGWALAPRGTHLGFGDKGYGWGLFQADLRTWEPALRGLMPGVDLLSPLGQARLAAEHLSSSLRLLRAVFPQTDGERVLRASIAAYNARIGAVAMQLLAGADVDAVTTPGPSGRPDYSADVLARAARLRAAAPQLFPAGG
jgi:hypothetical protein